MRETLSSPGFITVGTNDGIFSSFQPTGRRISLPFCEICHFDKQGQIVSGGCYYDQYTLLTPAWLPPLPTCRKKYHINPRRVSKSRLAHQQLRNSEPPTESLTGWTPTPLPGISHRPPTIHSQKRIFSGFVTRQERSSRYLKCRGIEVVLSNK
jgi:hypothetical protein